MVAKYKGTHLACLVETGDHGKASYTLEDGRSFKSPSAAGSAVMKGLASLDRGEGLTREEVGKRIERWFQA